MDINLKIGFPAIKDFEKKIHQFLEERFVPDFIRLGLFVAKKNRNRFFSAIKRALLVSLFKYHLFQS